MYGITEFLGFSGAISAMALGITLTSADQMGLARFKSLSNQVQALTKMVRAFYQEAIFLLKTYLSLRYLGDGLLAQTCPQHVCCLIRKIRNAVYPVSHVHCVF